MKRKWIRMVCSLVIVLMTRTAQAQLRGDVFYEIGSAQTDVGSDQGNGDLTYGFGAGATYSFPLSDLIGLAVGADFAVRAFSIEIPGEGRKEAGVFDRSDLLLDQFVGLSVSRVTAGLLFAQHRIHRGIEVGTFEFPTSGTGFLVRAVLSERRGTEAEVAYATLTSGELRLKGLDPAEVDSGRSLRISVRTDIADRWAVRGTYSDVEIDLEPVSPALAFLDHRQRAFTLGILISL